MLPGRLPKLLGQGHAGRDGAAVSDRLLGALPVGLLGEPDVEPLQRCLGCLFVVFFGQGVAIGLVLGGGDEVAHGRIEVEPVRTELGQGTERGTRMGLLECRHGADQRLAIVVAPELLVFPASHHEDPLAGQAGQIVEHEGAADATVHVAFLQELGQASARGEIERGGGPGELAPLEDPDQDTGRLELRDLAGLDSEFHRRTPLGGPG
jgi:hypothetical protein